jgi:hypothetical protein
VQTSIVSVTTPAWCSPTSTAPPGRRLARECNEWQARLAADSRGRFGFFAALPMLDTEGALQEIAYSLDTLKADGIGLLTSYENQVAGRPELLSPSWKN